MLPLGCRSPTVFCVKIQPTKRVLLADDFPLGDGLCSLSSGMLLTFGVDPPAIPSPGRKATFVIWEGDNITARVRNFFAIHNTTLEVEAEWAANVTRDIEEAVAKREVLATIPRFSHDHRVIYV